MKNKTQSYNNHYMKILCLLYLSLIICILFGCSSNKAEIEKTTRTPSTPQVRKYYQSQKEKDYLESLALFDNVYFEVEPSVYKWVTVSDITEYDYDYNNRVNVEINSIDLIKYEYDAKGNKISVIHKPGLSYFTSYDENNFEIESHISDGYWVKYKNDKFGNHIYSIDSNSVERYFEFDRYNRLTHVRNVGGTEYFYQYLTDTWKGGDLSKNYDAKITNSQNRNEQYYYYKNGLETGCAHMEYVPDLGKYKYVYKREYKYNSRNLMIYKNDTINGESWYKYIYDSDGKVLKKIQLDQM